MNPKLRTGAVVVIALLAALAIYQLSVVPLRCDVQQRVLEEQTLQTMARRDSMRTLQARDTLEAAERASRRCPADLDFYMIRGANLRILQRSEEAEVMFQRALDMDKRPEIYLQLGLAQLESGRNDEAVASFRKAVSFQPVIIEQVPVHLRAAVMSE